MWTILIFSILFSLYIIYLSIKMYPGNMAVYSGRIPLLGNLSIFMEDTWMTIKKLTKYSYDNGDVMVIYVGIIPIYYITNPDDCNTVLSTFMHKPGIFKKTMKNYLGNGLLFGPVSIWKEHRKILNPTFNRKVLYDFIDIFNSQSRRLVDVWKSQVDKGAFNQLISLEKNALETVCMTTAGVDICEQNDVNKRCLKAFHNIIINAIQRVKYPFYYPDCIYNISKLKRIEDANVRIVRDLTDRVLKEKRGGCKSETIKENHDLDNKFKPFLQRLLDLADTNMSEQDIQDQMNIIILTGYETTSLVLTNTLLLLGTYPEIQEKCQQEIYEIFGDSERDVNKDDLAQLKYIEAVLKESLRYCPIVPIILRVIHEDIQLNNTVLRKGHICIVSLYGALNSPKTWGSDVNKFIPERWLDPNRMPKSPNEFGAFGYGKRNCIGKVFALITMKVSLVHILRNYQVSGNYSNMKLKYAGANKPVSGHEISLERRK